MVQLDESNELVFEVFIAVRSQTKVDELGNILGLDYAAIQTVLEIYEIPKEMQRVVFDKVVRCFQWATAIAKEMHPQGT